jgi:hypothetical protein
MGSSFLPAIGAHERSGVASPDNAWSLEPLDAESTKIPDRGERTPAPMEAPVHLVRLPGHRAA